MKTVTINETFQHSTHLQRELEADAQLGSTFDHVTVLKDKTIFNFSDVFDSADETYLRFTFLENHQDINTDHDHAAKIFGLTHVKESAKDFREIDYRTELITSLFPKRTFLRGELQKVDWYSDKQLTDHVLRVEMVYTRDPFGFPVSRITTRTWIKNNGQDHQDKKITEKDYSTSPLAQIQEGKRRRGNIVDGIQLPTMALMMEALMPPPHSLSQNQILFMGRDFLDRFEDDFDNFVKNSSTVTDTNDPNFGRKTVVVNLETAASTTDTWLNETPATLQGASILQYLSNEFVDES